MKIGVEDVSISYELQQPAGEKKFVRRPLSAARGGENENDRISSEPLRGAAASSKSKSKSLSQESSTRFTPIKPMRVTDSNDENKINTNNNKNNRPKSAVRFQDEHRRATVTSTSRRASTSTPSSSSGRRPHPPYFAHGGSSSSGAARRGSQALESPIRSRPVTPNTQMRLFGNESFRQEYQSTTPIPAITRVRKELVMREVEVPWQFSGICADRDHLRIQEDMAKNLRRQKAAIAKNTAVRPGSAPAVAHSKTLPQSFSRNRNSRTNGPILNLPYTTLRRSAAPVKTIHAARWNVQTKDRDDEERAKPEGGKDLSLDAMYDDTQHHAYYRRHRDAHKGGTISKNEQFSHLFR
jgi:hypothetical protein